MFVHHVYFWLKNQNSSEDHAKLLQGIKSLEQIEPRKLFHVGVPASTNRGVIDASYNFSLLITFDSGTEEANYQQHPTHLKFVKECSDLWLKVVVYDSVDPS